MNESNKLQLLYNQDILAALYLRRNYIETGNIALSAHDCVAIGKPAKQLDEHQKDTSKRLTDLILSFENMISKIIDRDLASGGNN